MNKIVLSLFFLTLLSCDFNSDGAIHKINCDNLSDMEVVNHPKEIDTLIQNQLDEFYKTDSVEYTILGNVYNSLNLENCEIDRSVFNAQVRAKIGEKYNYWEFSYKKLGNKYIKQVFFKRR